MQNIYENDVVVCDVSNLNPNVMLETGLRLSTKKPIVIITDKKIKPPFDISTIGYLDYQHDLEFNAIEGFIDRLANKIRDVNAADIAKRYQPYISQFRFETVEPTRVTVSTDDFIREKINDLTVAVSRLTRIQDQQTTAAISLRRPVAKKSSTLLGKMTGSFTDSFAEQAEHYIDQIDDIFCVGEKVSESNWSFSIYRLASSTVLWDDVKAKIKDIVSSVETDFLLS